MLVVITMEAAFGNPRNARSDCVQAETLKVQAETLQVERVVPNALQWFILT